MPGARCTRGLVCNVQKEDAHEHTGSAEAIRHSLRDGFTAYSALSPVTGFLATVADGNESRRLDASVGASGPHAFAVRLRRIRQSAVRVHRIPPHVRDDRERPSERSGTVGVIDLIWVFGKSEYFCKRGWTGFADLPDVSETQTAVDRKSRLAFDGCYRLRRLRRLAHGVVDQGLAERPDRAGDLVAGGDDGVERGLDPVAVLFGDGQRRQ